MKRVAFVTIAILIFNATGAQKRNNRIKMDIDMMFINNYSRYGPDFAQWGFSYQRAIGKKSFLNIGVRKWTTENDNFLPEREGILYADCFVYQHNSYKDCIGEIVQRQYYKRFDLAYNYGLMPLSKYGELLVGAGVAYSFGENAYLDSVVAPTIPPYDNVVTMYSKKKESYFGIFPTLEYNYALFRKRLLLGVHAYPQKYFGLPEIQYEFGFHVGVLF